MKVLLQDTHGQRGAAAPAGTLPGLSYRLLLAAVALLSLAYYVVSTVSAVGQTTFDDAYMVTRYARHFLDGHGFCWNIADGPSYGITSPAFLMVVTAVMGLTGWPDAWVLTSVSYACGLLSVGVLVWLGARILGEKGQPRSWLPLLVVPMVVCLPPFQFHSLTGMETTLSLLANALLVCAIHAAGERASAAAMLRCLGVACLSLAVRPDNGVYALLLPPLYWLARDKTSWRFGLRYGVLFGACAAFGLLAGRALFGDYLPLPFYAKTVGFYEGYLGTTKWNAATGLILFWTAALPGWSLIVAKVTRRTCRPVAAATLAVFATFAYYSTVTQIMGHQARYYYPSLPFVVFAALLVLADSIKQDRTREDAPGLRLLGCLLVMIPALSFSFQRLSTHLWERYAMGIRPEAYASAVQPGPEGRRLPELGWWKAIRSMSSLLSALPDDLVMAASEYGYIGSQHPGLRILDFVGLHDRGVAQSGDSVAYVLAQKPDLIWLPHSDYTRMVARVLEDGSFQRDYEYFPEVYNFGVALRRDSKHYEVMRSALAWHVKRLYRDHLIPGPVSAAAPGSSG